MRDAGAANDRFTRGGRNSPPSSGGALRWCRRVAQSLAKAADWGYSHGMRSPDTRIRSARSVTFLSCSAAFLSAVVGCSMKNDDPQKLLAEKVTTLTDENARLKRELAERDGAIASLQVQVDNLLELGPGRLDHLFTVDRIELARLTGGADYDGKPGDDGITVYLRPLDAQGDAIKAAGEIRIQLLDVTDQGRPRELGLYVVNDPGQLRDSWYSGLLTDHYTIKCPWRPGGGPPSNREVTIRATFLDWLSGREFTAQKAVHVSVVDSVDTE